MKSTTLLGLIMLVEGILLLTYSATALDGVNLGANISNTSSNYSCNISMTNTKGGNVSVSISVLSSTTGFIHYYNYANASGSTCVKNTSINLRYSAAMSGLCGQTIYCEGWVQNCSGEDDGIENISYANMTCPTTTTTSSSTTSTSYLNYSLPAHDWGGQGNTIPSMNGSQSPMGNTTGLGSRILGLSKTNFLYITSLIISTLVMLGVSIKSLKLGVISGVAVADYFIYVLDWLPITPTLLIFVHFIAFIFFLGGRNR